MKKLIHCFAAIVALAMIADCAFGQAPPVVWAKKIAENYQSSFVTYWVSTAVDNGGNTFFIGAFSTPTLAVEGQTLTNSSSNPGASDAFIVKYAPNGEMLWVRQIFGDANDGVGAVGVDSGGNLIGAIGTSSTVVTVGTNSVTNNGSVRILVKFDPQGNSLWMRPITASGLFGVQSVSADPNGNILIAGDYAGTNVTFGTNVSLTKTNASNGADFLAKFDSAGTVIWAKQVDLNADHTDPTAAVDNQGNSYLLEAFYGVANFGGVLLTNSAFRTMSLAKYDRDGNLVWAREAGTSTSYIYPGPIWANADGTICASAYYYGSAQLQTTNLPAAVGSAAITFLARYDASGSLGWAKCIVGNSEVFPYALGTDLIGNYYVVGRTQANSLVFDGVTVTNGGSSTNFVTRAYAAKYASSGEVLWARLLTTDGVNVFGDGVVDAQGNVYFYGNAFGTNLLSFDGIVLQTPTNGTNYYFGVKISGPALSIQPAGSDAVISWPTNAVGLSLESATNLAGAWLPVTNVPVVNGQSFVVTNAVAGSERFYRLRNF